MEFCQIYGKNQNMQTIHSCVDNMDVTPTLQCRCVPQSKKGPFLCIICSPLKIEKNFKFSQQENQLMELCPSFEKLCVHRISAILRSNLVHCPNSTFTTSFPFFAQPVLLALSFFFRAILPQKLRDRVQRTPFLRLELQSCLWFCIFCTVRLS